MKERQFLKNHLFTVEDTKQHDHIFNYGKKKKQTVTSFAHKSFENSPSELKFLLKLLFSIIKHHQKNQ